MRSAADATRKQPQTIEMIAFTKEELREVADAYAEQMHADLIHENAVLRGNPSSFFARHWAAVASGVMAISLVSAIVGSEYSPRNGWIDGKRVGLAEGRAAGLAEAEKKISAAFAEGEKEGVKKGFIKGELAQNLKIQAQARATLNRVLLDPNFTASPDDARFRPHNARSGLSTVAFRK